MKKVYFMLERLHSITKIPVRYYDNSGDILLFSKGISSEEDPLVSDDAFRQTLCTNAKQSPLPSLAFEEDVFCYGIFADKMDCSILFGPVALSEVEYCNQRNFIRKHHLDVEKITLPQVSFSLFCSTLSAAFCSVTGNFATETEIALNNGTQPFINPQKIESQNYILENTEQDISRFSYSDERLFLDAIKEGKPELLLQRANFSNLEKVGTFAKKPFKHFEYLACSTFTVSCRAAIEGGLDSMTAYAISDLAKLQLERCREINEIMKLQQKTMVEFAQQVQNIKKSRSQISYIEQCKNYIQNHLNVPFSLDDIAAEVGFNKSYLSRRFSEIEGIGIQKYTRIKRVETAADMLKYSDKSISEIASYLCFPSQSHFGKVFREQLGTTPQRYRDKEKLIDYSHNK